MRTSRMLAVIGSGCEAVLISEVLISDDCKALRKLRPLPTLCNAPSARAFCIKRARNNISRKLTETNVRRRAYQVDGRVNVGKDSGFSTDRKSTRLNSSHANIS